MALFDQKKNNAPQPSIYQRTIAEKDQQIRFLYDEIGKLYFRQYCDMNADVSREINARCEMISACYIDIETCRLRILYERGFKECKNCRKANLLEHAYCCACGSKFPNTNDVNVVTAVDPETFVVKFPEVSQLPVAQAPAAQAPAAAAPVEAAPAAPVAEAAPATAAQAPVEAAPVVAGPVIDAADAPDLDTTEELEEVVASVEGDDVVAEAVETVKAADQAADPADAGLDPAAD